jgi:hypothetical protein
MKSIVRSSVAAALLGAAASAQGAVYFSESFASNAAGWTLGPEWQIGAATASGYSDVGYPDPSFDACGIPGGGVAGVVIGGNASTAGNHGYYYFESPFVNTAGATSLWLSFDRWLNSDYTPYMNNVIEVFNGSVWLQIWQSGAPPGIEDASWNRQTFDVSAFANGSFRVRFGFNITSSGVYDVSSWNLDNVVISTAPAPAPLPGLDESFDNNNAGWQLGPEWQIGAATAGSGFITSFFNYDPGFDATGAPGGGVAGVVIGGQASTGLHGFYYLTSPEIDTSSIPGAVHLTYDRFLNSDYTPFMQNVVDVFNGNQWITIWASGGNSTVDSAWGRHGFDVSAYKNRCFRVRFGFDVGSSGVYTVSSWNLDNVRVGELASWAATTAPCGAPAPFLGATAPLIGQAVSIGLFGGVPNSAGLLFLGVQTPPQIILGSSCTIDIAPTAYLLFPTDAVGNWSLPAILPDDPNLDGVTLDLQALMLGVGGFSSSNVLHLNFGYSG